MKDRDSGLTVNDRMTEDKPVQLRLNRFNHFQLSFFRVRFISMELGSQTTSAARGEPPERKEMNF